MVTNDFNWIDRDRIRFMEAEVVKNLNKKLAAAGLPRRKVEPDKDDKVIPFPVRKSNSYTEDL